MLHLFDTAAGDVRPLVQRDPSEVSMYVCGLTADGAPHLGHGRMALVFDILRRYLEFTGLRVRHVSNITDIDDKIIARAKREGRGEEDVARHYEAAWWDAVDALGVLRPDEVPHATAWVGQMVDLVSQLIDAGAAYTTEDGVYLAVDRVDGYGLLTHQSLTSLRAGARVEVDEHKRSPLDFALWKTAKPGEPSWGAPFGDGRPGWHTECVVMSLALLGEGFDIHGGGLDLAFPHHENERAQAVALGKTFARHWVHNGFVQVDGDKMAKSLGNFVTLTDLLAKADPRAYRLLVLRSHYRSPIEVSPDSVADAEAALSRLGGVARRFGIGNSQLIGPDGVDADGSIAAGADPEPIVTFRRFMDDDLDTPRALAFVFDLAKRANACADRGDDESALAAATSVGVLCAALGLDLRPEDVETPDDETLELLGRRDRAREQRDFALADELRDEIRSRGWAIEDGSEGSRLRRS